MTTRGISKKREADGYRIIRESQSLARCFQQHGYSDSVSRQLGFHLAEIRIELKKVAQLLKKGARTGRWSEKDYGVIESCVFIHWPMHLKHVFMEHAKDLKETEGWCLEDGFHALRLKKWAQDGPKGCVKTAHR